MSTIFSLFYGKQWEFSAGNDVDYRQIYAFKAVELRIITPVIQKDDAPALWGPPRFSDGGLV